jgi:hypothetical protein
MVAQEEVFVFNIPHYKNPSHRISILLELDIFHLRSPLPCLFNLQLYWVLYIFQVHPLINFIQYYCILFHHSAHVHRPLNLPVSACCTTLGFAYDSGRLHP